MPQFDENFWTLRGRSLQKPDLACLRVDADLYNILLLQLNEKLEYDEQGIWIADETRADEKFLKFIDLAVTKNIELIITPEYSCPWRVIRKLLAEDKLPGEHNLWILGCQSIHPHALQSIIQEYSHITWIYEEELLTEQIQHTTYFFDPVCMILKTRDLGGVIHTVVIVQFKTEHFGGQGNEWERDHLIKGKTFFVLSNQLASSRLIVLVCSDALRGFNFNELQEQMFLLFPLLLVHIQLNQRPFQSNYKAYRNLLFAKGGKDFPKEVIALNWSRGVHLKEKVWNEYGGSGFYLKSDKLNLQDVRINQNHLRGLYYTNWEEKKAHIYFLAYDEYVFLVRNTKPSQEMADPSQHMRTGPEVMELYKWNVDWNLVEQADDGFCALCEEVESEDYDISCIKESTDPINTERIIALTLGNIGYGADWHQPRHLFSFQVLENEHNNRINFNHDPEPLIREERIKKIMQYAYFKRHILGNPSRLPKSLQSPVLKYDTSIEREKRFLLNLHPVAGERKWTGVFLGISTIKKAKAIKEQVQNLFKDSQQGKSVIVWYFHDDDVRWEYNDQLLPNIRENTGRPVNSYKKRRNS